MFILFSGEILKKKKRKTKVSMIILRIIFWTSFQRKNINSEQL
jgi:hypothetical protein